MTASVMVLLWRTLGEPDLATTSGTLTPDDMFSIVRISLAAVAGIGGIVALVVAFRRQKFIETDHLRAVAAEKREDTRLFTERFRSAAEQMGSDKAAVRLAGLYALRELGDDWVSGRQMCADVICAYLRMPFRGPFSMGSEGDEELAVEAGSESGAQEFQVRLTAQKLIASRLPERGTSKGLPNSWDIALDLSGAHLINLDLSLKVILSMKCDRATFHGDTWFNGSVFLDDVGFYDTVFNGRAVFTGATFRRHGGFAGSKMLNGAYFVKAKFDIDAEFLRAGLGGEVEFRGASVLHGRFDFHDAQFDGRLNFSRVDWGSNGAEKVFVGASATQRTSASGLPDPWSLVGNAFVKESMGGDSAPHSGENDRLLAPDAPSE
ncbi:pentapeptide repeat-containing protein [Jiangella endophytica]|uniref:pentapeptide repeat-containing protein n=1 Tax=Jiangella endophytica TaxID=1623398 RepID=UPI0018E52179|nr:pentapeptide repeat-containing protein [Jiangella endophytica]